MYTKLSRSMLWSSTVCEGYSYVLSLLGIHSEPSHENCPE